MKKILQVKNLEVDIKKKKPVKVLKNISFDLFEGEILGIVGESGSGKSVLAQSFVKLLPFLTYVNGQILFFEEDLLKKSLKELVSYRGSKIGYIFQDPMSSLNPTMKIGKQILEALKFDKTKGRVYELLSLVGISSPEIRFSQYPHELSGGQRQRIGIAIALAMNPKILIADEPTTALDVTIQAEMLSLLKNLQKKFNMSIIFISHDLKIVSSLSSRIIVMYAGEILEEGNEIIKNPRHPYTKLLLQSVPTLDQKKLHSIDGTPPELSCHIPYCVFCGRCPNAMKKCSEKKPPFFIINNQKVACWLYEDK